MTTLSKQVLLTCLPSESQTVTVSNNPPERKALLTVCSFLLFVKGGIAGRPHLLYILKSNKSALSISSLT